MEKSYLLYLCRSVAKTTLFIKKCGEKPFSQVLHSFPNMISTFYQTYRYFFHIFGGKFWFWPISNFRFCWTFFMLGSLYKVMTIIVIQISLQMKLIWTWVPQIFFFWAQAHHLRSHVKKENSYWPPKWTLISNVLESVTGMYYVDRPGEHYTGCLRPFFCEEQNNLNSHNFYNLKI